MSLLIVEEDLVQGNLITFFLLGDGALVLFYSSAKLTLCVSEANFWCLTAGRTDSVCANQVLLECFGLELL